MPLPVPCPRSIPNSNVVVHSSARARYGSCSASCARAVEARAKAESTAEESARTTLLPILGNEWRPTRIRTARDRCLDRSRSLLAAAPAAPQAALAERRRRVTPARGSSGVSAQSSAGRGPPRRRPGTCRVCACASASNVATGAPFTHGRWRFAAGVSSAARWCALRAAARPDLPSARSCSNSRATVLVTEIATAILTALHRRPHLGMTVTS
jgi:hypothetical protein